VGEAFSTSVAGLDLRLWRDEPLDSWLRERGRTRILIIDDQWTDRQGFFDVGPDSPSTEGERLLRDWLNTELQFFPMPADYTWSGAYPSATFSDAWFESTLDALLEDPRPIAAVLLDLLFGDQEHNIKTASGKRFLSGLRRRLPDVPVLILSNLPESLHVVEQLKEGRRGDSEILSSFQDYLPKVDPTDPHARLIERVTRKLVWWADLSDPALCAFSPAMRRLARQMRQIVLRDERIEYEAAQAATMPRLVTLSGDYGAGKNYLARHLVATSRRQANPYHTVNFAGTTDDGVIPTLFGSLIFTGAVECYHVDPTDGAVLARSQTGVGAAPAGTIPLGAVGVLQLADITDQSIPVKPNRQRPLHGSVLLDELGSASEKMQTRLLGVLNSGRFAPYLGNQEIPTQRCLDVWYLITVNPQTELNLRDDLRGRLAKGYRLNIPPLAERYEDVLPLVLSRVPEPRPRNPHEMLTDQAIRWLLGESAALQVRDLIAILLNLPDISSKRPYGAGEVQQAFRLSQVKPATRDRSPLAKAESLRPGDATAATSQLDVLECLTRWKDQTVEFPSGLVMKERMRGLGTLFDAALAAVRLAYLELAVAFTEGVSGEISATRTHQFQYGEPAKANIARDCLAAVFEADESKTLESLRRSDRLARLAIEISKRRKKVDRFLQRIAEDPAQRKRLMHLGWRNSESEQG
jgi:DNA-binding NtrC family response regulator